MSYMRTVKQENPFVQMDKYFIEDETLSFEAKGLLAYVLSKPNTWQIRKTDLIKRSMSGRTRIDRALLELMSAGYMNWYQEKNEDGTFADWVYDVYERPEFNPEAEYWIEEGKRRIQQQKAKNKERNSKKAAPKTEEEQPKADNQPSEQPKADYPQSDNPASDKQPSSNNELRDIELSNNDLNIEEEEGAGAMLLSAFKKNINSSAGESIQRNFEQWLQVLPFDVILNEIEYAAKTGGQSFAYLEKALIQDKNKGVTNLLDLENKRIEYAASKQASKKKHHKNAQKPVREEVLPEWFTDKENQEEATGEPTEAQKQALEFEKAKLLEKLAAKKAQKAEKGV